MQEKTKVNEIELFDTLVSDCKDIITERIWASRTEIIIAHGEIGKRILEDSLYKKYSAQNKEFCEKLAKSIGISYSEVCRSIQFYQKFKLDSPTGESWDKFKEDKAISWNTIKQKYLPQIKGDTKLQLTPKFKIGDIVAIEQKGAIIVVKDTGHKVVYKVAIEIGDDKEDIWIEEKFLSIK